MTELIETLRVGLHLAKSGRYDEAAQQFGEVIEKASQDPRGWFCLGVCRAREGRLEEARKALIEARRLGHPRAQAVLERLFHAAAPRPGGHDAGGLGQGPAAAVAEGDTDVAAQAQGPPGAGQARIDLGKPVRVMLVEDKAPDRQAICEALYDALSRVSVVESPFAESASRTIVGMGVFDVAVIDWDTSPRSARELLEFLKMTQPHIPVIVLSATWNERMAREAIGAGADYCLVKASGYARVLPLVIEQRFKQSYALQEKVESELGDLRREAWHRYFDALDRPALLVNQHARVLEVNAAAAQLLGSTPQRLIGEQCERLFHQEQDRQSFLPVREAFESGRPVTVERHEPRLGRTFRVTAAPVKEEEQTVYLCLLEELGSTPRAEGAGQAGEMLRLAGLASQAAFELDGAGRLRAASKAAEQMLGYPAGKLTGLRFEQLIEAAQREAWRGAAERATAAPCPAG